MNLNRTSAAVAGAILITGCASTQTTIDEKTALVTVVSKGPAFFYSPEDLKRKAEEAKNLALPNRDCQGYKTLPNSDKGILEEVSSYFDFFEKTRKFIESLPKNSYTWSDVCPMKIGIEPLRLSESTVELPPETEARVHLRVSGGTPPYSPDRSTLGPGVKVEVTAIAADGATLIIHVPKGNASDRLVLPVSDSTGNTRNLVITFKAPE